MLVNHINIPTRLGCIYCHQLKCVTSIEDSDFVLTNCMKCSMFNGTYQGEGVECLWDDPQVNKSVVCCVTPTLEQQRAANL